MQTDLGIYPYYLPGWNDSIYNVYAYNYTTFKNGSLSGVEFQRLLQYNDSQQGLQGNLELLITFNADKPVLNYAEKNGTIEFLAGWLSQPNVLSRIPDFSGEDYDERGAYNKPVINYDYLNVSSFDSCKKLYGCIYYDLPGLQSTAPNPFGSADTDWGSVGSDLDSCLRDFYKVIENLYCPMVLTPVGNAVTTLCSGRQDLSANSWYRFQVDRQLQTFLESGVDDNGIWWQGAAPIYSGREYFPNTSTSVSNLLGRQLMGNPSYSCSLETKCSAQSDCRDIGSRTALGLGAQTFPEFWAYAVITSFENLSTQLSNQYVAIKGAAIAATLGTFKVSDFYKIPQPHYGLLDILSGLAFALTLLGGFIPGLFGNPIGAVSATLGAVGGFLGRRATNNTAAMVPQEAYADSVLKAYLGFVDGLDTLGKHLFNGDKIGDNFTILDMIAYGAWVNSSTLQPLYNTETQLATEIVSRSINGLWQTPPYNQSFVLYVDLRDHNQTRCKNDTSGPQDLKYCGGGGVYYTYNFIEDGHGQAHLDYPYGADKLKDKFGIDPAWVTEASAKTYNLAKSSNGALDPFNASGADLTRDYIIRYTDSIDPSSFAGRSPGSWTLPVCNASTWGSHWNWDYVKGTPKEIQIAPCLCGPNGNETKAFVRAAGLFNSQAYYRTCKLMTDKQSGFIWPQGITEIDLGFGAPIKKPKRR